jgi:hypothetical protein
MKKEIVLSETRTDVSYEQTLVRIETNGDLVIEYYDRSPVALKSFGDSDYEHWTTVRAEQKDTFLLELIKDKFGDRTSIQDWLTQKGIIYELESYT